MLGASPPLGEYWDWGIPTAASVTFTSRAGLKSIATGGLKESPRGVNRPYRGGQQVEHPSNRGVRREDLTEVPDSLIGLHEPLASGVRYDDHGLFSIPD